MIRLWLKFIFASVLSFGPLFLLKIVSIWWLSAGLGMTAVCFSVAPIFIGLDMHLFYYLPGIRLTDEGLWVKNAKSISHKFYSYQDLVQIEQLTTAEKKRKHQVRLFFLSGSSWFTNKRPGAGVPFLIHLTNEVKKRCNCSVSPVFDVELASEKLV